MMRFYYRVKAFTRRERMEPLYRDGVEWGWPPVASGFIFAESKEEARKAVGQQIGVQLPMRVKRQDIGEKHPFVISIYPGEWFTRMLEDHTCRECKRTYTLQEKLDLYENAWDSRGCCGPECTKALEAREGWGWRAEDGKGVSVIYRITHVPTGRVYIGQTRQAFTLRWWQHVTGNKTEKFGKALMEHPIHEWSFQVVETVDDATDLDERERYHIVAHDSVANGFNTR